MLVAKVEKVTADVYLPAIGCKIMHTQIDHQFIFCTPKSIALCLADGEVPALCPLCSDRHAGVRWNVSVGVDIKWVYVECETSQIEEV